MNFILLQAAIACNGFNWSCSPAYTELEMVMMNWMANLLKLPKEFTFTKEGKGGGIIHGTASESTLIAVMSARFRSGVETSRWDKLVMYASDLTFSATKKAAHLCGVQMRLLETDEEFALRGEHLLKAMEEDRKNVIEIFIIYG